MTACLQQDPDAIPPQYERVFLAPRLESDSVFARLSAAEQVDLFVFGLEHFKPARIDLAWRVAQRGDTVLPDVIGRLSAERDDFVRWQLLRVLEMMNCSQFADVRQNAAALAAARDAVVRMTIYRQAGEDALRGMAGECRR